MIIGAFFLGHSTSNLSLLLDAAKAAVPVFQVIDRVGFCSLRVTSSLELANNKKGSGTVYKCHSQWDKPEEFAMLLYPTMTMNSVTIEIITTVYIA